MDEASLDNDIFGVLKRAGEAKSAALAERSRCAGLVALHGCAAGADCDSILPHSVAHHIAFDGAIWGRLITAVTHLDALVVSGVTGQASCCGDLIGIIGTDGSALAVALVSFVEPNEALVGITTHVDSTLGDVEGAAALSHAPLAATELRPTPSSLDRAMMLKQVLALLMGSLLGN